MTKNNNSYYEIILIVLSLFLGVAFIQDSNTVKIFLSAFILVAFTVKEIVLFFDEKRRQELKAKLDSLRKNEITNEIEKLKSDITKINIKMFNGR